MNIKQSLTELVGHTPLLEIKNIQNELGLYAKIAVKLEFLNPAGSVKDRAAMYMILDAEKKGIIGKGATVIEPTSGNTGIGIASLCASRGYKAVLVMPDTMSIERRNLLKAYGAQVVLTDGKLGMKGAIEKAREINEQTPNSVIAGQFDNPSNPESHYETTAPEIWKDTDGKIDAFFAGIGSGGTISGVGKYLKEQNKKVKIYGIEPGSSPLISKGVAGAHKIQGIGANFIPKNYNAEVVDRVIEVSDEDAYETTKLLAKKEGILVGISSGAALFGAITLAKQIENKDKLFVVLLPDTGDRYLSTPDLFC